MRDYKQDQIEALDEFVMSNGNTIQDLIDVTIGHLEFYSDHMVKGNQMTVMGMVKQLKNMKAALNEIDEEEG